MATDGTLLLKTVKPAPALDVHPLASVTVST
jgi:hypothetical protein